MQTDICGAHQPHPAKLSTQFLATRFRIEPGPMSVEAIRMASLELRGELQAELETVTLRAQLQASESTNVELFFALAQNAPEALPGSWALLYDLVAAEERFWVYPQATLGDIEDGLADAFTPYLSKVKLQAEWDDLLAHMHRVALAQASGKQYRLPT
jgi:hypothetical protein